MPNRRPPRGPHARRAAQLADAGQMALNAPQPSQPAAPVPQSLPVGQVISCIIDLLESDNQLQDLWVEGEVRNFSKSGAGHMYFRLADEHGALSCVFFRGRNRGMRLEQGDEVLAHGQIGIYRERGDLQLIVDSIQPRGTGVLQAEFERIRAQLEAEGLFSPERKRPLPRYPRRIGVVTSAVGAVWHDVQQVLGRRWPLATLVLSSCLTQGDGAAESIAAALGAVGELSGDATVDVVIVARGGGSPEDLWAYNEEPVARAIYACPAPVISAVGHETDFTIADYAADVRAPTPSVAAELVAPDLAEEGARVRGLNAAGAQAVESRLARLRQQLTQSQSKLAAAAPDPGALRIRLQHRLQSAERLAAAALSDRITALAAARGRLGALDPTATLARGYAMITNTDGRVLASAASAAPGERVRIQMYDGRLSALIESTGIESDRDA